MASVHSPFFFVYSGLKRCFVAHRTFYVFHYPPLLLSSIIQDFCLGLRQNTVSWDRISILAKQDSKLQPFIFIIDEWDAICREFKTDTKIMDEFVSWLWRMFKGSNSPQVFAGVYMTGILPIKKYKTASALNNFMECSMVEPVDMAPYFGFAKEEVQNLAEKHNMDFNELEKRCDGYQI